jgi:hypothetical protein
MPLASDSTAPFPVKLIHQVEPTPQEERWLVQHLFVRSSVGLVGGPPKAFKTWIAAELALAVAANTPALGRFDVHDPGPVLFFGAEDPLPDLRIRFEGIARARNVDLSRVPLLLLDVAQLLLDDHIHLGRLQKTIALHSPRLLVLDPFVRLVRGLDENSARDVSAVLGALRTLQREHNVAVLLTHHMRKSPAAHPAQQLRGSGDFSAWADSGLYLTRQRDDRFLFIEHRGAPAPLPIRLRLAKADPPHLTILDQDPEGVPENPLEARVLEHLNANASQPAVRLRELLHVRKADLLTALRSLATRGLVTKTENGWSLSAVVE